MIKKVRFSKNIYVSMLIIIAIENAKLKLKPTTEKCRVTESARRLHRTFQKTVQKYPSLNKKSSF
jgi:hypothetical protein